MGLFGKKKNKATQDNQEQGRLHQEEENAMHVIKEEENVLHRDDISLWKMTDEQWAKLKEQEKIYRDFRRPVLKAIHFTEVAIEKKDIDKHHVAFVLDKMTQGKNELIKIRTRLTIEKEIAQKILFITSHFLADLHQLRVPIAAKETHELQLIAPDEERIIQFVANFEHELAEMANRCDRIVNIINALSQNAENIVMIRQFQEESKQLLANDELFRHGLAEVHRIHEDVMGRVNAIKHNNKKLEHLFEEHIRKFKEIKDKSSYKGGGWERDQVNNLTKEERERLGIKESEVRSGHRQG